MESGVVTLERVAVKEVAVEEVVDLPFISKKFFVSGCFREGEDHRINGRLPEGWGDCKKCTPDFLAYKNEDFIPNGRCKGYIPCRGIDVLPKDENKEKT